jgi:hypothetical protein
MPDEIGIIILVVLVLLVLLIKGVIKTFKRQPVVAILCLIFLAPIYFIWAFVELFTGPIKKESTTNE